jgi:Kef-type K+ transport system membrane component KefB
MEYLEESQIFVFLIQLLVLLGLARGLGELFNRFHQPAITAEILVGILLGPTLLGRVWPGLHGALFPADPAQWNMLETVAWFGILFFLLKIGIEMDFTSAWRQRGDALVISVTDVVLPMIIAFIPCLFLANRYMGDSGGVIMFSLFIATVSTISALPMTARVLQDLRLYRTDLGFLIMCALSMNDIVGWLIFTLILGFMAKAGLTFSTIAVILFSTVVFTVLCLTVGRGICNYGLTWMRQKRLPETGSSLTFVCLVGFLCGAITLKIGIHALFGFFIAGMMVGECSALSEKTRNVISQMVHAIFIPLFFASIGLKVDFWRRSTCFW